MMWKVGPRQRLSGRGEGQRAKKAAGPLLAPAVAAALLVVMVGTRARVAQADPAEVESLIAQGNELRRQNRNAEAVPLFKKAFDVDQTPRTAGQLGLAELAADYPVEAADHLALALESPDHPWVAGNRASLEKMLAKARESIGEVTVLGTPAGAAVSVKGRAVGVLPLPAAVRVPAGRVKVSVSAPSYAPMERVVQVRAKHTERIDVALEKLPGAVAAAGPSASHDSAGDPRDSSHPGGLATTEPGVAGIVPADGGGTRPGPADVATVKVQKDEDAAPASSPSGLRIAAWATAGVAVAGLASGIWFQHAHNADVESYRDAGCPPDATNMSTTCQALHDRWPGERTWSLVGYLGGGALAVTSAALFFYSRSDNGNTGATHAGIHCAPTLGALFCRGEF